MKKLQEWADSITEKSHCAFTLKPTSLNYRRNKNPGSSSGSVGGGGSGGSGGNRGGSH